MCGKFEQNRAYLTTSQAAERSGLSKNYLTQLLRKGTLEGFQLARDWLIYTDSFEKFEKFLATPRKSGPKGPRKKHKLENYDSSPHKYESDIV
jgi:excisionase family DNA binding protein